MKIERRWIEGWDVIGPSYVTCVARCGLHYDTAQRTAGDGLKGMNVERSASHGSFLERSGLGDHALRLSKKMKSMVWLTQGAAAGNWW
jgi:hypothetical protein